jgi:Tfp pilus assembly protein PilP
VAATIAPKIPSSASVAKQATVTNAISLNKVNLIGVYGKPSSRRALVRLANGRYKKVQVGDTVDGGRVAAIGESELRYVKGGRNLVLKLPQG